MSPQPEARQGLEFDDAATDRELHHSGETASLARSETHRAKAKASPNCKTRKKEMWGRSRSFIERSVTRLGKESRRKSGLGRDFYRW